MNSKKTSQIIPGTKKKNESESETAVFLESILENIPAMIFIKDAKNLRFILFNKAGEELLGYSREDMLGKNDYDFFPKAQADFFTAKDHGVLEGNRVVDIPEEPINTKDKGLRWLHTKKIPLLFVDGVPQYLLGISLDITEEKLANDQIRKINEELELIVKRRTSDYELANIALQKEIVERIKAEEETRRSEERYRFMADSIPQIVWTADTEGNLDYCNKPGYSYFGLTYNEIKGWSWANVIHADDLQTTISVWQNSIQSASFYEIEHRIKRFDGEFRWHLTRATPMKNEQGVIIKWFGTMTDVHDQKIAMENISEIKKELEIANERLNSSNKELIKTNADLDNFVYAASHDLKAPVSNLSGLMDMLLSRINEHCKHDEEISTLNVLMTESIERFQKTIQDLAEIGKAQKIGGEDVEKLSISEYLEGVELDIQKNIQEAGAVIKTDINSCSYVHFSKSGFRSILYNLLINAIKYRFPGRPLIIEIKSWKDECHTIIEIKDNGLGMKPGEKEKLFTMFQRFHANIEGTGVGLYVVKRIIDNSKGKIEVESEEGKGTVFRIYFMNSNQT